MPPLTVAEFVAMLMTVTASATVQGSVGFGANLLAVPVIAILEPSALPATLTIWGLPLNVWMAVKEREHIDWRGALAIIAWRIPGTIAGSLILAAVRADTISVLGGAAVLIGVAVSAHSATVPVNRWTTAMAGLAAGTMGTATSIGGPPLALLYQTSGGAVLRSTLAASFMAGATAAAIGQAAAGALAGWHVVLALALLPGLAVGFALSRLVIQHLDGPWLRRTVLALAAGAAVVAVARGLA
jgi:hypothetical protein